MKFASEIAGAVRERFNDPSLVSRIGQGRTFWVLKAAGTGYVDFVKEHPAYDDGTAAVYTTVDAAISACTANRGDAIYVLPDHTETVTATSIAFDVAGVSVICLGTGLKRPTFTYGAAAATITVSAANCTWKGGHFIGNFDDVAAAFTLGAAKDFTLEGGTFADNSSSLHFLSIVVTGATANAADGLRVVGNTWYGLALAPNAFVSVLGTLHRLTIMDNDVNMAATNDAGHFLTLADKVVSQARVRRNTLTVVGSTGAAVGIFLTGSGTTSTGDVADNRVSSLDTTAELIATAGTGLVYFNNLYTGTADTSGKTWPLADAA